MTHQPRTFAVVDPRTYDGDPFEVAERSARQAAGVTIVLRSLLPGVRLMVRNAELERQLLAGGSPDPHAWEEGPQGRLLRELSSDLEHIEHKLTVLSTAAGFNPKAAT